LQKLVAEIMAAWRRAERLAVIFTDVVDNIQG
jgi:hypothetical protein